MNQTQGYEYLSGIVTSLNRQLYYYGEFKPKGYHVESGKLIITVQVLNNPDLSELTISLLLDKKG